MKTPKASPPLNRDVEIKAKTLKTPGMIANPYRLIALRDESDLFLAAKRDHGLQISFIEEDTRIDDLIADGPVLFRVFAAFTEGPNCFDEDTLRTVMRNAEDVLFHGNNTTRRDLNRLVDAAVRGGSAVYVTIDEGHEVMWNKYMDRIWLDG
jgi:hypothetical protein